MTAEILSIGNELLRGDITDTNASFLAKELHSLCIQLEWVTQVNDSQKQIVEALRRAWQRSDLIITTGGLGPTVDDLTRESVAELVGEEPKVQPELEKVLRDFFTRRGFKMTANNIKQAWLIPSAHALSNPNGTAPGWWVEKDGRNIVIMPGPPHEMQRMWHNTVVPDLRKRYAGKALVTRTIKTFGMGESILDDIVAPIFKFGDPLLGIYVKPDGVHVTITAQAKDNETACAMIEPLEKAVVSALGEAVWGRDEDTLETIIGKFFAARDMTVATIEYGSNGLLVEALAGTPGFKGSIISSDADAGRACGLSADIVSRFGLASVEAVIDMAEAVRAHFGASVGVAMALKMEQTIPGERAIGSAFVAVADGSTPQIFKAQYPGVMAQVRRRALTATLFHLRKSLLGADRNSL